MTGSRPSSPRWPGWNLTAIAALVAALNLVWTRTSARLLLPHAFLSAATNELLLTASAFLSQLGAVLALALLILGLANRDHRRRLFPPTLTISLVFITGLFVLLAGRSLMGPVGGRPLMYLKVAYGFLSAFLLVGAWRAHFLGRLARRQVVGFTLVVLSALFGASATFLEHSTTAASALALTLDRAGERLWVFAGAASSFLLAPRRRDCGGGGWYAAACAAGILAAAGAFALLVRRFELVQTVAAHGLNLDVPAWTGGRNQLFVLVLAAGAGGIAFTVIATLRARGPWRLCGYGVVLVGAAGYAPANPGLLATSLVGSLALAVGLFALADPVDAAPEQRSQ